MIDRLKEKMEKMEKEQEEQNILSKQKTKTTVEKMKNKNEEKTQAFSCKTTPELFGLFKQINRFYGQSNNSVINKLIRLYVEENRHILKEDE